MKWIVLWQKKEGAPAAALENARVILWEGFCHVHHFMSAETARTLKAQNPDARLVVHPECSQAVVSQSASAGSTAFIIKEIQNAQSGESFIIGTESHLVERLKNTHPELKIQHLGEPHPCVNMARNTLPALFGALEQLENDALENVVTVPEEIAADARIALNNMLALG